MSIREWNWNAIQSGLTMACTGLGYVLIASGCSGTAEAVESCEASRWISPEMAGWGIAAITILKLGVIPAIAEGGWVRNIFQKKVPVSPSGAPGTVPPEAIKK